MLSQTRFEVGLGHRDHQLDAVELVNLTGTRVVVDCDDVCCRIVLPDGFDHAFADDMVRQTAEGLGADDV